jgi:ribosomal protein S18 acetylase RimI-like enzyme
MVEYRNEPILSNGDQKLVDAEWHTADAEHYGKDYSGYAEFTITARVDGQLAGIAKIAIEGGVVWLEELLVFENFRKQGIGTELIRRTIASAMERNCHKIILETDEELFAFKLYKKHGFAIEAKLPNHYAHKNHVIMTKYLKV